MSRYSPRARLTNTISTAAVANWFGNQFVALPPGSFESIATSTVSSNTTTVTFSSIPSTYQHLQVRAITRGNATLGGGASLIMYLNNDTGNNYSNHNMYGTGSAVGAWGYGTTYPAVGLVEGGTYNVGLSIVDILDYANTNKNTTFRSLWGSDVNGGGYVGAISGAWYNTAAVSTITFSYTNNFYANTSFALYGIKGVS